MLEEVLIKWTNSSQFMENMTFRLPNNKQAIHVDTAYHHQCLWSITAAIYPIRMHHNIMTPQALDVTKPPRKISISNIANFLLEVLQLLLHSSILLGHLLEFRFPLITVLLESLNFAFEVAGLYIRLAESVDFISIMYLNLKRQYIEWSEMNTHLSLVSLRFLSASSASSSNSCSLR